MLQTNTIHNIDALNGFRELDAGSVQTIVTSPPYLGLRDYGVPPMLWPEVSYSPMAGLPEITVPEWTGCLGLEPTPEMYVGHMVAIFHEARRSLRDNGTLWLNLGDSYANDDKWGGSTGGKHVKALHGNTGIGRRKIKTGLNPKNLMGIPWRVAFALQADGWYLRSDIIWEKSNAMPESVTDRCTKAHEYIFMLAKSPRYYFDAAAIAEPVAESTIARISQDVEHQKGSNRQPGKTNGPMKAVVFGGKKYGESKDEHDRTKIGKPWVPKTFDHSMAAGAYDIAERKHGLYIKRNKRSVWTCATANFKAAHFAVFPPELIEPCILAGCPQGGVVCDPFMGSGTTAQVATALQRDYIGFDVNPDYIDLAYEQRLSAVQMRIVD